MDLYDANSFIPIDKRPVFKGNVIVRLCFRHGKSYIPYQSTLLSTIILNDSHTPYLLS